MRLHTYISIILFFLVFTFLPAVAFGETCNLDANMQVLEQNGLEVTVAGDLFTQAEITNYQWDFNDGTRVEGEDKDTVTHTYDSTTACTSGGSCTITLIASNANGDCGSVQETVSLSDGATAQFQTEKISNTKIEFDASASTPASGEEITAYEWDFDYDGSFNTQSSGVTVTHTFPEDTQQSVVLKVSDSGGNTAFSDRYAVGTVSSDENNGGGSQTQSDGSGGLVPCNGPDCGFDDLIILIENLIDFLIQIGTGIAALMFAYAGFLYLTARGDKGQIKSAHNIFSSVIWGFIIMLVGWLLVNTLLSVLGVKEAFILLG